VLHRLMHDGYGFFVCYACCPACKLQTDEVCYDTDGEVLTARAAVRAVEAVWNRRDG